MEVQRSVEIFSIIFPNRSQNNAICLQSRDLKEGTIETFKAFRMF